MSSIDDILDDNSLNRVHPLCSREVKRVITDRQIIAALNSSNAIIIVIDCISEMRRLDPAPKGMIPEAPASITVEIFPETILFTILPVVDALN